MYFVNKQSKCITLYYIFLNMELSGDAAVWTGKLNYTWIYLWMCFCVNEHIPIKYEPAASDFHCLSVLK